MGTIPTLGGAIVGGLVGEEEVKAIIASRDRHWSFQIQGSYHYDSFRPNARTGYYNLNRYGSPSGPWQWIEFDQQGRRIERCY